MNVWTFNIGTWTLNAIDIAILVICLGRGVVGAVRGFFSDFSHTAGLFGGAVFGMLFTSLVFPKLAETFPQFPEVLLSYLTFIVLVLVGYIAFRLIGSTLDNLVQAIRIQGVSTISGFFWGMLLAAFTLSVIIYILSLQKIVDVSKFFDTSLFATKIIEPLLPLSIDAVKDVLNV